MGMSSLISGGGVFPPRGTQGIAFDPFINGAATDLNYKSGRYLLDGTSVSAGALLPSFTRSSNKFAETGVGDWVEYAVDTPAIVPGVGYVSNEGWTNLENDGLNPRVWNAASVTISDQVGKYLGFENAALVTSLTSTGNRAQTSISGGFTASQPYAVRALYASVSGKARVVVRDSTHNLGSHVSGDVGQLVVTSSAAGSISNLENINHGNDIYEAKFIFTPLNTVTDATVGIGPCEIDGSVIAVAVGVTETAYHLPYGKGATAADALVFDAADLGMDVTPSSTGVTMIWRGTPAASGVTNSRCAEIAVDGSNRLSLIYQQGNLQYGLTFASGGSFPGQVRSGNLDEEATIGITWRSDGSYAISKFGLPQTTGSGNPAMVGTIATVSVGCGRSSDNPLNADCKNFQCLPYSVTDAELERMVEEAAQ